MKTISKVVITLVGLSLLASCDPSFSSYKVKDKSGSDSVVTTPEASPEAETDVETDVEGNEGGSETGSDSDSNSGTNNSDDNSGDNSGDDTGDNTGDNTDSDGDKTDDDSDDGTNINTCALSERLESKLAAKLVILNSNELVYKSARRHLTSYMDPNKTTVIKELFLVDQVDIAPREYDEGVLHLEHELIVDPRDNGELNEYYGIEYNGYINVKNISYEGEYQIGLLSDDGILLEINNQVIIDNQGAHSPRFNCSKNTFNVEVGTPLKLKLNYFQGPKVRVANTLVWRKIEAGQKRDYSLCKKKLSNLDKLEDKGWEIIPQDVLTRDIGSCSI